MTQQQEDSSTRENTPDIEQVRPTAGGEPTGDGTRSVNPFQDVSRPDGGEVGTGTETGPSKADPVSTGPNVKNTIAGRN
jgi:hypothetical protein